MNDKNQYQIISVFNPRTEEKERDEVLKKITSWVEEQKAEVNNSNHWGNKELAYEINDLKKGDFWIMDVESEKPLDVRNFNIFLNREPKIIRYLILKK